MTAPNVQVPEKLKDFRAFLYLVWKHLNLPDPTPIQYDIAHYLQHGPRRKVIEAFRGVGKSWITSAYVIWRLLLNPQLNFLVVSASKDRADNFSTFTLRLINEIPILRHLIPRDDQRNSKIAFDVGPAEADHAPSVKSVGIFGQLTGGRADEIIADDVEVPNNAFTQAMRDKLAEAVKEFDAILKPGGKVTYLGTPQTEQSLYNLLEGRGYEIRIWPGRFPKPEKMKNYEHRLAPFLLIPLQKNPRLHEMPTDPKRFNEMDLMEREASYGRSGFALQFMLDTTLSDADRYPLKLNDLIVMELDKEIGPEKAVWGNAPELVLQDLLCVGLNGDRYHRPIFLSKEFIPYKGTVMAIDPSGRGSDELGYAVVKMLNGYLFLTAAGGLRGGYTGENLTKLCEVAKENKANRIIIESNFGDGMFNQLLMPYLNKIYPCTVEEVRHSKQKELRIIDTLEPVMNQHRLIVDSRVIEGDSKPIEGLSTDDALPYQLFHQMSRITKDRGSLKHDDRLDALAIAVAYWVEVMNQDVDKQIDLRKDNLLQEELKVFLGHPRRGIDAIVFGPKAKGSCNTIFSLNRGNNRNANSA